MKQLFITIIPLLSLVSIGSAQSTYSQYNGKKWEQLSGNGKLVQLNPAIEAFTTVEINHMNARIVIEAGQKDYSLNVSIDDNLKDFFRYKLEGKTLQLSFDLTGGKYPRWLSTNNTVVTIKVPMLDCLRNSGNAKIELKNVNQKTLSLISSGNPDIFLSGTLDELRLQNTGNSVIDAGTLAAQKILLSASGNSKIVVHARELVKEKVSGNTAVVNRYNTNNETIEPVHEEAREYFSFSLKNNSLLPAKVTVVSYRPNETGNGTNSFLMIPFGTKKFRFPAGTKIYLADSNQVNTVMSGNKISDQIPFLIVKKEDNNKSFNINQ